MNKEEEQKQMKICEMRGNENSPYIILDEIATQEEVAMNKPFYGKKRRLLNEIASYCKINLVDVRLGQVINTLASTDCFGIFLDNFFDSIKDEPPRKIIFLGLVPPKHIFGISLHAARGIWYDYRGHKIMFSYSLTWVMRFPELMQDCADDFKRFFYGNTMPLIKLADDGYPDVPYHYIGTTTDLAYALNHDDIAIDIETNKKAPFGGEIFKIGIYAKTHDYPHIISRETIKVPAIQTVLRDYLSSEKTKIIHNGIFEYGWFRYCMGVETKNIEDTMLMHYALDSRSGDENDGAARAYHSLKSLSRFYYNLPDWSGLMKPYVEDYSQAPDYVVDRYLAVDLITTRHLRDDLLNELIEQEGPYYAYKNVMLKLIPLLSNMSLNGVDIDFDYMERVDLDWEKSIQKQILHIQEIVGYDININSPKQVAELFYDRLKLKIPQTVKGKRTKPRGTDKHIIKELAKQIKDSEHNIPALVGAVRGERHIRSTYITGLPKKVNPITRKLHTDFLIHGTDTGRLASRNPNLQNIPARIGPIIRDAFVAPEGWSFVDCDYKQLEFRVLALLSQDKKLIEFINSGRDIHSEVASAYFGVEPGKETDQQRIDAKAVVFGIAYGRTAYSIAEEYELPLKEAERRVAIFKELFPDISIWIKEQINKAMKDHYVETYHGRRRRFPLITDLYRSDIERHAINSPIQGTASDICGLSGRACMEFFSPSLVRQVIVVHDSLVQIARDDYIDTTCRETKRIMEDPNVCLIKDPPVVFEIDMKVGKRWGSLEKYKIT